MRAPLVTAAVLLSISAAHGTDCLKEKVTFHVPHGTALSVASRTPLTNFHRSFSYGDSCIAKEDSRFTVQRIEGQVVTGHYQLVENDISYLNTCPSGTVVMTVEMAGELCRNEAANNEREFRISLRQEAKCN